MQPRKMILAALIAGPIAGTLIGLSIDTAMNPPPEPAWRKARPDPIFTEPQRLVDAGPQDLSPTWYIDRMPTWKRRAAMQDAAAYPPLDASYDAEPLPEPADDQPVVLRVVSSTMQDLVTVESTTTPLDEAADEAQAAALHARAAVPETRPAATQDGGDDATVVLPLAAQAGT